MERGSPKDKAQVTIEYALAMVILATVASLAYIFYQGLTEATFYGTTTTIIGLEGTVSLPFP